MILVTGLFAKGLEKEKQRIWFTLCWSEQGTISTFQREATREEATREESPKPGDCSMNMAPNGSCAFRRGLQGNANLKSPASDSHWKQAGKGAHGCKPHIQPLGAQSRVKPWIEELPNADIF